MAIPVGLSIRNMGVESTPDLMRHCAVEAENAGLHSIWITDHIAIPPDDAEGSGGRYMDPLTTLAWLAGQTSKILLGTGVLVLPYRPKLALAKSIATVQELSNERLILGVGIGWMKAEFNAVGVDLRDRAKVSEDTLAFLMDCFSTDIVTVNNQQIIFKPRPKKPLIFVGGGAPHATNRALDFGDGWLPMGNNPEKLAPHIQAYKKSAQAQGKKALVYTLGSLGQNRIAVQDKLMKLEDIGVDAVITAIPYSDNKSFSEGLENLQSWLA